MRSKLSILFNRWRSSIWFLPSILTILSLFLSQFTLSLDRSGALSEYSSWLFQGKPGAAREILSTIASSTITVIAVIFSVTIVAIQQSSTQYSPRALSRFTRDLGNQLVLGFYIGTFVYSLLILKNIRATGPTGGENFIPGVSTHVAIGLTLVNVGLLIFFIHHITTMVQSFSILRNIRQELDEEIRRRYPEEFRCTTETHEAALERCRELQVGERSRLHARKEGYIRHLNLEALETALEESCPALTWIRRPVGDHVVPGTLVMEVWSSQPLSSASREKLQQSFELANNRSIFQDPLFGFRQIVDIALKALSPGINDPTTAEEALISLKGALALLIQREIPSPLHHTPGKRTTYLMKLPAFHDFVRLSLEQIRQMAAHQPHVLSKMLEMIEDLIELSPCRERTLCLRHHERLIRETATGRVHLELPPADPGKT